MCIVCRAKHMRRATHEGLSKSSTAYQPSLTTESVYLALDLLRSPSQWFLNIQRANAAFIINLVYGSNPDTMDTIVAPNMDDGLTTMESSDRRIHEINDFAERLTIALLPGSHFVEFLPWMKYIPAR